MKAVIQRVTQASVQINNQIKASIQTGLLVLVGIEDIDNQTDAEWLSKKIAAMRIFNDNEGKMNLSCVDVNGDILVVSQFTLHASTQKGNRPSFIKAARPEKAIPLYNYFIQLLEQETGKAIPSGVFGADMLVIINNDGPVTILMDSQNKE